MIVKDVFIIAISVEFIERQELELIQRDVERLSLFRIPYEYTTVEASSYRKKLDSEIRDTSLLLHTIISDPMIIVVDT